jgi:hypothetical protein
MSAATSTILPRHPDSRTRERRSRAFHRPWRIWIVSLLLTLSFVSFCAFIALAVALPVTGSRMIGVGSLACLALFIASRLSAFVLSGRLHCGLCHGAVMTETGCRKHADAVRVRPLSYRATAVLGVLLTLSFKCMYCGMRFRLWK